MLIIISIYSVRSLATLTRANFSIGGVTSNLLHKNFLESLTPFRNLYGLFKNASQGGRVGSRLHTVGKWPQC